MSVFKSKSRIIGRAAAFFAAVIAFACVPSLSAGDYEAQMLTAAAVTAEASAAVSAPVVSSDYISAEKSITFSWSKVSGASGYYIYRYSQNCTRWIKVGETTSTSFESINLLSGLRYGFRVKAYKIQEGSSKKVFSDYSNVINTAATPAKSVIVAVTKTANSVTLNWNKLAGQGYEVYQLSGSTWKKIKTISGKDTIKYTVSGLTDGTSYSFKVRAYGTDADGRKHYGSYSAVRKVTTTASTPVAQHGQLSVSGANIVDKNGDVFKIKGMSTHGIMWEDFSDILTSDSLKVLRDDWKCNTIRIAVYTEEWGGYTTESGKYQSQAKQIIYDGVQNATDLGMYVIIDWHILSDGNPQTHQSEAVTFFKEMSKKYKNYNNVIYEICNEPNNNTGTVTWSKNIKPYAEKVISAIRSNDSDALIICGTGTWSQDIQDVVGNKLSDKNTVYALHFYANTHTDWLRTRLKNCYNNGLPILVSEFGTCNSSGSGGYNASQTTTWLKLLDSLNVGYVNWSACGKSETCSAFVNGTNLKAIKSGESQLTQSGKFIRAWYRTH